MFPKAHVETLPNDKQAHTRRAKLLCRRDVAFRGTNKGNLSVAMFWYCLLPTKDVLAERESRSVLCRRESSNRDARSHRVRTGSEFSHTRSPARDFWHNREVKLCGSQNYRKITKRAELSIQLARGLQQRAASDAEVDTGANVLPVALLPQSMLLPVATSMSICVLAASFKSKV